MPAPFRVGIGVDAHRFTSGRPLVLGGIEIPHSNGLEAHSDGDVLTHAILDALLGAAGAGDKGKLFPPTDPQFKDAKSTELLHDAMKSVIALGYDVGNVDVSVMCEEPRIGPHREKMCEAIATALGVTIEQISIKGTTLEGMGFTGRKEGIAAIATVLLINRMTKEIRTRYAPSPTGFLHVGGLRTALYNYLFARKMGGKLLLRVEDTDRTRLVEGAVENFLEVFDWLGISFDESPKVGGPHAPYVQSERLGMYTSATKSLAEQGYAYACFCSSERLDQVRADQQACSLPPMYDRHCRNLSKDEVATRLSAGESHVWRMAVPDNQTVIINDLIRGSVNFESSTIDDQVLMKSDGFPTYHLANVVDDHDMQISHVIRGEEWLPSTPKHVLLYKFFGWEPPQFAHLPLLLNPDRSKMSKRSGDVAVEAYREKGILPQALLNFVALLGWHPQDEREFFSLEELAHEFSLERVNKAGAVFDQAKLRWMNTEYLTKLGCDVVWDGVAPLLPAELLDEATPRVRYAVESLRPGAASFGELASSVEGAFAPADTFVGEWEEAQINFVAEVADALSAIPASRWNEFELLMADFKAAANSVGARHGLKGKGIWMTLRMALTGREHGPELGRLVGMWGREGTLNRLHFAIASKISTDARP